MAAKPRIGILEAGPMEAGLAGRHGEMSDWFIRYLGSGGQPAAYTVYRSYLGEAPRSPLESDAWLITGSALSVLDDEAWISEAMVFARRAAQVRPLIGICFGHQLLAQAFGGRVEKSQRGWGVGVHTYEIRAQRPWMVPGAASLSLLASHQDQVVSLPPGAEILAASDFCPYAMMQIGENVLSIQSHPEMTGAFARERYQQRRELMGGATTDTALASLTKPTNEAVFRDWLFAFIAQADREPA